MRQGRVWNLPSTRIALGLIIGQGLVFASMPGLTRLYSQEEVGRSGVFLALIAIVGTLATLRVETLLPKASEHDLVPLLKLAALLATFIGLCGAVVYGGFVASSWLEGILFGFGCVAMAACLLGLQTASRLENLNGVAASKVSQGAGQVAVQIGSGSSGLTALGMQSGIVAGYAANAFVQWRAIGRRVRSLPTSNAGLKRGLWRTLLLLTLAASLNLVAIWIIPIFINASFGAGETGQFTIAQRLVAVPAGLVVTTFAPVLVARVGARVRAGESPSAEIRSSVRRLGMVGVLVVAVAVCVPTGAYEFAFGPEWTPARSYVAALAPAAGAQVTFGALSLVLIVQGRTKTQFMWDLARTSSLVVTLAISAEMLGDPLAIVWCSSGVLILFYLLNYFLVMRDPALDARSNGTEHGDE